MFMDTLTATKRGKNLTSLYLLCEDRKNKFTVEGGRLCRKSKRTSQVGDVDAHNLSEPSQRSDQECQFAFHLKEQACVLSRDCIAGTTCLHAGESACSSS